MKIRRFLFWPHLMAGCLAGAAILIMSVTGMLLTYERQILSWVDREARLVAPSSAGPLAPDYIFTRCMQSTGAVPTGITLRSDPTAAVEMNFGRERIVYLNPYSGAKQGENSKTSRIFFERVTSLHRWLGGQGESKAIGRSVTGACNLLFVFLVTSGVVWPWLRGPSRMGKTWNTLDRYSGKLPRQEIRCGYGLIILALD
jgi:uncharacterized iron-regulated membrane protein